MIGKCCLSVRLCLPRRTGKARGGGPGGVSLAAVSILAVAQWPGTRTWGRPPEPDHGLTWGIGLTQQFDSI